MPTVCVWRCVTKCMCSLMGEVSLYQCGNSFLHGLGIGSSGILCVCVCVCHRMNERTHERVCESRSIVILDNTLSGAV